MNISAKVSPRYTTPYIVKTVLLLLLFSLGCTTFGQLSIPRDEWVATVDAFQSSGSDASKVFDNDLETTWHSPWGETSKLPHWLAIDMQQSYDVVGFVYHPRPDGGNGTIAKYEFYTSMDGTNWGSPVASGTFQNKSTANTITFPKVKARHVKLVALSEAHGNAYFTTVAEFFVLEYNTNPPAADFSASSTEILKETRAYFKDISKNSPESFLWRFPGGTPATSSERHPIVQYATPGSYDVTLIATNINGTDSITKKEYITVHEEVGNMALLLDGDDNDIRIGMDTINENWTIEAWIKGDDLEWNFREVIIGAGEYGNLDDYDEYPLCIKNGKLNNDWTGISSPTVLDNQWHHIAASCDGSTTRLFLDGNEVASKAQVVSIIPGCIGSNTESGSTFGGIIDEVRIWRTGLSAATIKEWMGKSLTEDHPAIEKLKGYYPFESVLEELSPNIVGTTPYPFHAKITKVGAKDGSAKALAKFIVNDNDKFEVSDGSQQLIAATVVTSDWDMDRGSKEQVAQMVRIAVNGSGAPQKLTELKLDLSKVTKLSDITKVELFYKGMNPKSPNPKKLFSGNPSRDMKLTPFTELNDGVNYFEIRFDISPAAAPGNSLESYVSTVKLNSREITLRRSDVEGPTVIHNSTTDIKTLKVMTWNLWHGGKHLGDLSHGKEEVIEIIKATNADVILLQEAYGSQRMIKDALGYYMHTFGDGDNLALLSRYPVTKVNTSFTAFRSIGVTLTLPNNRTLAMFDVWLQYAYRPEYTTWYVNDGLNPQVWIDEDKILSYDDAKKIMEIDINPHVNRDMPIILGGDFNSCSHLDWTEAAKGIHNGYGPVAFPTSQIFIDSGWSDSYRTIHPDEVAYPGGTWAATFGQVDSRIDYIYYRGDEITPQHSRVVRTSPTLDYVWPGDHAGVLTTFKIKPDATEQLDTIVTSSTAEVTVIDSTIIETMDTVVTTYEYEIKVDTTKQEIKLYDGSSLLNTSYIVLKMDVDTSILSEKTDTLFAKTDALIKLKGEENNKLFSLYPNPVVRGSEDLKILLSGDIQSWTIYIVDKVGNLLYTRESDTNPGVIRWNQRNQSGILVASDSYVVMLQAELKSGKQSHKMSLVGVQ